MDYVYQVDHFVSKGETLLSRSLSVFPGGKGLNQSIAMGRAGLCVFHGGNIGQDGTFLLEILGASGVDTSLVSVLDTIRTGHAIIQNDPSGDNGILLYGGANQAATRTQIDQVLSHFEAGDYLVLQNEINELDYIVETASQRGMILVFNPSPVNSAVLNLKFDHIHWILLNEVEASQLTGLPQDQEERMAAGLGEKFPAAGIVLTLGGKGSLCIRHGECIRQPSYPTHVVDTTAAGDTFTGYFLSGLAAGQPVADCLKLASLAASIAVSRRGAEPSIPRREEVFSHMASLESL